MPIEQDSPIAGLLTSAKTVAVVGLSPKPDRPSFEVAQVLQQSGYRVIPVNPVYAGQTILGENVYGSLAEVPVPIDIVDVFRKSADIPPVAEQALLLRPKPRAFWMQLGIENAAAARALEGAGIAVVQDRCMAIELARRKR